MAKCEQIIELFGTLKQDKSPGILRECRIDIEYSLKSYQLKSNLMNNELNESLLKTKLVLQKLPTSEYSGTFKELKTLINEVLNCFTKKTMNYSYKSNYSKTDKTTLKNRTTTKVKIMKIISDQSTTKIKDRLIIFRDKLNNDTGFKSCRRHLIIVSIILLSLVFTEATIKEANTFLFKIEFLNQNGIPNMLLASLGYLLVRYYSFANPYHQELTSFWTERLLNDKKLFHKKRNGDFGGVIGSVLVNIDDIQDTITYKLTGFFQRELSYISREKTEEGVDSFEGSQQLLYWKDTSKIMWSLNLLKYDLKFSLDALFRYRENLEILSPYYLSFFVIITIFISRI